MKKKVIRVRLACFKIEESDYVHVIELMKEYGINVEKYMELRTGRRIICVSGERLEAMRSLLRFIDAMYKEAIFFTEEP
mgnify:CR=1 FL=1